MDTVHMRKGGIRCEVVPSSGQKMPERVPVETSDLLVVRVLDTAGCSIVSVQSEHSEHVSICGCFQVRHSMSRVFHI